MGEEKRNIEDSEDGRPVEAREGRDPAGDEEAEENIPDPSTIESVGY